MHLGKRISLEFFALKNTSAYPRPLAQFKVALISVSIFEKNKFSFALALVYITFYLPETDCEQIYQSFFIY